MITCSLIERGSLVELCHQEDSPSPMSSPESVSHLIHPQNGNLTSNSTVLHSFQHPKGMSNPTTARLFAHFTTSPNTCASYIQGQDRSPSAIECEVSQSPTTCDLTTLQTFSKCLDDDADHRVRPACFQFHDPRVKVCPISVSIPPRPHPIFKSPSCLHEKFSSSATVSILIFDNHTMLRSSLAQSQHRAMGRQRRKLSFYSPFATRLSLFSVPKPASVTATPIQVHQTVPPSRLSSPFVERNAAEGPTSPKISTPQKNPQSSSVSSFNPASVTGVFSQYDVRSQPPLIAPSPLRTSNSETSLLVDQDPSKTEESGPGYLQRGQRTPSPLVNPILSDPPSHLPASIDVTETPARGRRLKIFQETSEESFEESLMIHGYAYRSGVSHNGQLSQTALDWLHHPTSAASQTLRYSPAPTPSVPSQIDTPRTEYDIKKRKRLESFSTPAPRTSKLRIVDVEGRGRILLSIEEEASPLEPLEGGNPIRQQRAIGKRKPKGNGKASPSKRHLTAPPSTTLGFGSVGPDWLDAEFPWSLKTDQLARAHWETQAEKMRWIQKFLDRDSDSESEGEEIMPSSAWGELYQHPPMPCRRGRGKMVPIKATDRQRTGTMVFPSDPADARAALLSRRAVRILTLRRVSQARRSNRLSDCSGSGGDDDSCICEGRVKDRGSVQCNDCERWYHLRCIGVRNAGELGDPNDPWYCSDCMKDTRRTVTPELTIPSSEPTIVPTDDDCLGSLPKDPLFFVGDSERSPFTTWPPHTRPLTPTRGGTAFEPLSGSSSTAYSNKGDPSTPQTSSNRLARIYETPNLSISVGGAESTFDLTTTPSRGVKFSSFTPRSIGPWSFNPRTNTTGVGLHTPLWKHTGSFNRIMGRVDSVSGTAPQPPAAQDSPSRRKEGAIGRVLHSRRLHDSPMGLGGLSGGGRFGGFPILEESPVVRSAGKRRMREEVDLGDGFSAEEC